MCFSLNGQSGDPSFENQNQADLLSFPPQMKDRSKGRFSFIVCSSFPRRRESRHKQKHSFFLVSFPRVYATLGWRLPIRLCSGQAFRLGESNQSRGLRLRVYSSDKLPYRLKGKFLPPVVKHAPATAIYLDSGRCYA